MGVVLAVAATRDHRYVAETETHGLEECDEYGHCDVIISDRPVDYPELQAADLLVALSQDAADDHVDLLLGDGVFVYDSDRVSEPPPFTGATFGIPFARLVREQTGECEEAPNMLALGAVVRITGVVSVESLRQALRSPDFGATRESRLRALDQGLALDPTEWRRGV
jgi:2-oxoglutarate ferredoxin oxidoreductase subunit gamma